MPKYEAAGQFLKDKRQAAGLSREQLAQKLNTNLKLIENWERGYQQPRHYVEQLAAALNVEIGELRAGISRRKINSNKSLLEDEQPVSTKLGQLIKTLREDAGMTPDKLAREISVAVKTIENWESGKIRPSQHALGPLAWALGVSQKTLEAALSNKDEEPAPVQEIASPAPIAAPKKADRDANGGHSPAPSAPIKRTVSNGRPSSSTNAPTSVAVIDPPVVIASKPALTNVNALRAKRAITMASKSIRSKLAVARLYGDDRVQALAELIEVDCDTIDDEAGKLSDDNGHA